MINVTKGGAMAQSRTTQITIPGYLRVSKVISVLLYLWVIFGIIVLLLRVFLLAFSANMTVGFSHFIMQTSSDYLEPFRGIFVGHSVGETGYLDVSALFAIIVYMFIAWGFHSLMEYIQDLIDRRKEKALIVEAASAKRK